MLCFAGVRSLRLTGLCAGFALAWMIADLFGASIPVGLVIAVAGAIGGLVLISLVFRCGCSGEGHDLNRVVDDAAA